MNYYTKIIKIIKETLRTTRVWRNGGLSDYSKFWLSIPQKPITLTFFLNLFNELAFAYRVAKLKLLASISATDAKPRNVSHNYKYGRCKIN
ncbi:hypothetical protein [Empedobacter falsenii]